MQHPDLIYTSPYSFTWKERFFLTFASSLAAFALKCVGRTTRIEVRNGQYWEQVTRAGAPFVIAIWHESLALGVWHYRNAGIHTLTSFGFDGELAARVVRRFGNHAFRGSSSRGGAEALDQMQKALELGITVGFTLDGPRGPRRQAKAGAAVLCARARVPIIPVAFVSRPAWRMRSWDRLMFPKPFARIICAYAPPTYPPDDHSPESVETIRLQVEQTLNRLHAELDSEL